MADANTIVGAVNGVFIALILIANLALLWFLVRLYRSKAHSTKHVLIGSVALADLVIACVVLSVEIQAVTTRVLPFSTVLFQAIMDQVTISVSLWGLWSIQLDFILRGHFASYKGTVRQIGTVALILVDWVGSLIVFGALIGSGKTRIYNYRIAVFCLNVFVPTVCILVTFVGVMQIRQRLLSTGGSDEDTVELSRSPIDLILACCMTILLFLPITIYLCLLVPSAPIAGVVLKYFSRAKSFLLPLAWFSDERLRRGYVMG